MKRIDIVYDGHDYSTADQDLDVLQVRVGAALAAAEPDWLTAK